jgi:hypothetical protein
MLLPFSARFAQLDASKEAIPFGTARDFAAYLREARAAIASVVSDPTLGLTRNGFIIDPQELRTPNPFDVGSVATALAFIDRGLVSRVGAGDRRAVGSYGLKHAAEKWGRENGFEPYVGNGDFIAAIVWRKIPYRRDGGRSPNCQVGLRYVSRHRGGGVA